MKIRLVVITLIITVVLVIVLSSLSTNTSAELNRTTIIEAAESPKAAVNSPQTIKVATEFAQKATIGNMFEVESSKIALDESANERIKKFAQMMVEHHSKIDQDMRAIIDSSSVDKANLPSALDKKHAAKIEKLKTTKGAEFDNLYVAEQKAAHDEAVVLYRNYAANGKDRALQNYAAKTLPMIEEHQKSVSGLK